MPDPKQLLRTHGLKPKKSWGQNFLVKQNTIRRIIDVLDPGEQSVVLEFGAGTGALTFPLAERTHKLFAVERDRELAEVLRTELLTQHEHVQLIEADAARFDISQLELAPDEELLVVGNLPYQITAPILFKLHEQRHLFKRAVLMVQKEVADRLVAKPGQGKDYSILSILFGAFFSVTQAIQVSRNHFFPKPRVDSTVVMLETLDEPVATIPHERWFIRTVKICFAQRRKTIQNNLRAGFPQLDRESIADALTEVDIDPGCRAETLDIPTLAALAIAIEQRHPDNP